MSQSIYTTIRVNSNGKRVVASPERRFTAPDPATAAELAAAMILTWDEQRTAAVSYNEDGMWTFTPSTGSPVHIHVLDADDTPRPCSRCGVHDAPSLHRCADAAPEQVLIEGTEDDTLDMHAPAARTAIEHATVQFWSVTGTPAAHRAAAYAQRLISPTATHIRDNATGREGVQVDMFGPYLVIQFTDHRTELRDVDSVTLIPQPGARY